MTTASATGAAFAAASGHRADPAVCTLEPAWLLLPDPERGQRIDTPVLRHAMETAFGASDACVAGTLARSSDAMRDRLRPLGLFGEIISQKLSDFVPTEATGIDVIAKLPGSFPVARTTRKGAA